MKQITFNNNVSMPQIGLGTFLIPQENFDDTIREAYRLGYRQFDTAWRYHNERWLADALKKEGVKRQDVFITTKLNADGLYWRDYQYGRHSILAQDYEAWEAILVDDGSTDSSAAIIDEYAMRDSRFRIVHKENGGVSNTRNVGMDISQGEWMTFVDGDDQLAPGALSFYASLTSPETDLVMAGYTNAYKIPPEYLKMPHLFA